MLISYVIEYKKADKARQYSNYDATYLDMLMRIYTTSATESWMKYPLKYHSAMHEHCLVS